jgi:hypothetical protein
MNPLKTTADARVSLQEQVDRHKCEREDSSQDSPGANADVLLRQVPDEDEEDEEENDPKEDDDDGGEDEGYSE